MSSKIVDSRVNVANGWDGAIQCAEADLKQILRRGRQLRRALRLLKKNRDDGLEWPNSSQIGVK